MKIENYNFLIPYFNEDGSTNTVFIPQPNKILFDTVTLIMGHFYTKIRSGNLLPEVFVNDYRAICDDLIEKNGMSPDTKSKLENFLEHLLISSSIINDKGELVSFNDVKIDDDTLTIIRGYTLFTSALFRYTPPQIKMSVLGQLITSQTATEYSNSLRNQFKEPSTEKKASSGEMDSTKESKKETKPKPQKLIT